MFYFYVLLLIVGIYKFNLQSLSKLLLKCIGLSPDRRFSPKVFPDKFVWIGEPHTHLIDIFITHLVMYAQNLHKNRTFIFPVNQKYFICPLDKILYSLGAFPVNTTTRGGAVKSITEKLKQSQKTFIAIAPSGTRKYTNYWRSGFYYIAMDAQVPVVASYICFKSKKYGTLQPLYLTGNKKEDMDKLREFYKGKTGVVAKNASQIKLKDE